MATLTTLVDGQVAVVAPVNANFAALNTEIAGAMRTGYATGVPLGNVGAAGTTLHSWTMPANTLTAVGDGLIIDTQFLFAANANAKSLGFQIGAGATYFVNSTAAPNNKHLHVTLTVYVVSIAITNTLLVLGTPILMNAGGGATAFEDAITSTSTSNANLATNLLIKFTGTATTTNDIIQNVTRISVFKAAA